VYNTYKSVRSKISQVEAGWTTYIVLLSPKAYSIRCLFQIRDRGFIISIQLESSGRLSSPKQRKQMVGLFSVNTNNIAAFSACFTASAAASCGSVSLDGVGLMPPLSRGRASSPPWNLQFSVAACRQRSRGQGVGIPAVL
jgi:hypothetical protein